MANNGPSADKTAPFAWALAAGLLVLRIASDGLNLSISVWWGLLVVGLLATWPVVRKTGIAATSGYVALAFLFAVGFAVLWLYSK